MSHPGGRLHRSARRRDASGVGPQSPHRAATAAVLPVVCVQPVRLQRGPGLRGRREHRQRVLGGTQGAGGRSRPREAIGGGRPGSRCATLPAGRARRQVRTMQSGRAGCTGGAAVAKPFPSRKQRVPFAGAGRGHVHGWGNRQVRVRPHRVHPPRVAWQDSVSPCLVERFPKNGWRIKPAPCDCLPPAANAGRRLLLPVWAGMLWCLRFVAWVDLLVRCTWPYHPQGGAQDASPPLAARHRQRVAPRRSG